jgi:uncharacterized membrane protein YeaQ/YmgE (transglycosylase-associated protein family)
MMVLLALAAAVVEVACGLLGGIDVALVVTLAAPSPLQGALCGVLAGLVVGSTSGHAVITAVAYGLAGAISGHWRYSPVAAALAIIVSPPSTALENSVLALLVAQLRR